MNKFCKRCGTYYNSEYEVDHVYECYTKVNDQTSGTATYHISLPGIYKLIELNAIDPNRAIYKLSSYGLVGKVKNESTR